ncbi:poly polymerase 2 ADP-ribosyltransferase 2 [Melanomma pulvis-pyrius CBS 109.77]|uniref:Poly [ADP-ribose] polymerase n=1 Tax=Melanomma pulvis-pyrius CBS 109.77 TaxID=1314802 RepID=A0A6A6WX26_9PLEO|nr:poly polymerase 2 ADP-ribosyltransferase 2 [Melanomma pulvis-pyrius CBS 109.77]
MAPSRKPAMLPLAGFSIALSGTLGVTHGVAQSSITSLGGEAAKTVTADTTYLVSTQADVDKASTKVKAALKHGIPIVSLDWLDECASSLVHEDPQAFLLASAAAATPSAPAPRQGRSKKTADTSPPPAPAPAPALPLRKSRSKKPAPSPDASPVLSPATTPVMAPVIQKAKGKKRAASPAPLPPPAVAPEPKKPKMAQTTAQFGEGSVVKSKDIVIPLDENCFLISYRVYVDDDGVVFDAALNQTNASNNNNKFYRIQLLHNQGDFKTWTRWGRVGDRGQTAVLGSGSLTDAMKQFEKKFKDKSGIAWKDRAAEPKSGKYAYIERSYGPDSDDDDDDETGNVNGGALAKRSPPPESKLAAPIQSLLQLIFNQQYMSAAMTDLNYDAEKMPLGKLSKATINRAFQSLKDLAVLIQAAVHSNAEIEDLSNRYYSLIPHNFGRNRPPVISDSNRLKQELDLLESLGDMKEAADLMKKDLSETEKLHPLDRQFRGLGLEEMTVLDPNAQEYQELASYLINTRGSTHNVNFEVESIFRIERNGEFDRFDNSPFSKIQSDRRLLWHGSRATNFGGILSQGLRIAPLEAPVSGYMFGKGIYLADMSSKSANYCCSHSSGGHALLLLCEAELGQPMYELTDASYDAGEDAIAHGSVSTWGKGMVGPAKWKDAGGVHPSLEGVMMPDMTQLPTDTNVPNAYLRYNEYITYDIAQVRLRYLFRVKM